MTFAGETFLGGGIVNYINYKRFNVQICNAFFGQGTQVRFLVEERFELSITSSSPAR